MSVTLIDPRSLDPTGNYAVNNLAATGTLTAAIVDLTTSTNVNLGSPTNLHISGGSASQVLSTDGSGTLAWVTAAASGTASTIVVNTFSGTGSQTAFTLSSIPTSIAYTIVNITGIVQLHSAYTVSGAVVTFSAAPFSGANIEVIVFSLGSGGGGAGTDLTTTSIDALGDVIITSPTSGQTLSWNGTQWVNSAGVTLSTTSIDALGDVVITSPTSGQTLSWDGTQWVNAAAAVTGASRAAAVGYSLIFGG